MLEIFSGRDKFYQWDVNQKLIVDDDIIAVQYDNGTGDALVCGVYEYEGQKVADVPNVMLQTYWAIHAYAYCGECVRGDKVIEIEKRSRPDDYVYTETETLRYTTLYERVKELEEQHIAEVSSVAAEITAANAAIDDAIGRIEELEKNPVSGVKDWNENNPESPNYIENRTHYEEWCVNEIMPLTVLDTIMEEGGILVAGYQPLLEGIEENKEYTIIYNGVEYKSKCANGEVIGMDGVYLLGDYPLMMGGESTGEPYAILIPTADSYDNMELGAIVYMLDGATELTLGIKYEGFVIHKVDDKYINFKQPNWKAKQGEPGYIMNRTHYVEHWGEYELKLAEVNGLVAFEIKPGVMAYKVSDVVLPNQAVKQAMFNFYKDGMGYGSRYAETNSNDGFEWGDVPDWGGVFSCYNTNWANGQLGLNVPENGTYLYITGDYTRVNVYATDVYYKLNTNYIDLSNYYTKSEVDTKVMPIINSLGNTSLKGVSDTGAIDIKGYTDIQVDIALQGQRITDTIKVKMYDINNTFICDMAIAENLDTSDVVSIQAYYRTSGLLNIDVEVGNNAILRDIKRYVWRRTTGVSKLGTIRIYTANGTAFGDNAVITIMGGKA